MRLFDLVIFDLDGTLIDNRTAIRANFNHALKSNGYQEFEDKKIDKMIGTPLVEMFKLVLPEITDDNANRLAGSYRANYMNTSHIGTKLLKGVPEVLVELKSAGFKLAVATTKSDAEVKPLLERIDIYKYFDLVTGIREELRTKPHPDMLNYLMKSLDAKPEKTAMVGDTYFDILAARNAGVYSIAVLSGVELGFTSLEELRDSKPDATVRSLAELPGLLSE